MMLYWPCAKYIDHNGKEDDLFTYEGFDSIDAAKKQLLFWKESGFNIYDAHIDVYNKSKKEVIPAEVFAGNVFLSLPQQQ